MAPADQFSFQRRHHFVKVGLCWKAKAHLNPHVSDALALGDPLEADLLAPTPEAFSLACPNGGKFLPIDLGTRCLAKDFQHSLGLV